MRVLTIGRQEAADWAAALDVVVNRLVTVERSAPEQAQFISSVKDQLEPMVMLALENLMTQTW